MKEDKAYIGDEIVEGNKIIAEFMGVIVMSTYTAANGKDYSSSGPVESVKDWSKVFLKYHSSWDWLMPVVEKIRGLWNEESLDLQLLEEDDVACKIKHLRVWSEIDSVWQAVIQFITWFNKQTNNHERRSNVIKIN